MSELRRRPWEWACAAPLHCWLWACGHKAVAAGRHSPALCTHILTHHPASACNVLRPRLYCNWPLLAGWRRRRVDGQVH